MKQLPMRNLKTRNLKVAATRGQGSHRLQPAPNLFLIFFLIFFIFTPAVRAFSSKSGTTGGQVLKLLGNVRLSGMGSAGTADRSSFFSVMNNPAALPFMPGAGISFAHYEYYADMRFERISGFYGITDRLTVGADFSYLNFGEVMEIKENIDPASADFGRYSEIGNFNSNALLFGFSCGFGISKNLYLGLGAVGYREKIYDMVSAGAAGKLGLFYNAGRFSFGFQASNFGAAEKFFRVSTLPAEIRLGAGLSLVRKLKLNIDAVYEEAPGTGADTGLELELIEGLFLRTGYRYREHNGFSGSGSGVTAGFGLSLGRLQLDYAYNAVAQYLEVHRIELSYRFEKKRTVAGKPAVSKKGQQVKKTGAAPVPQTEKTVSRPVQEVPDKNALKKKYFNEGSNCLKNGDYPGAIAAFDKVLEIDPGHEISKQKLNKARELNLR